MMELKCPSGLTGSVRKLKVKELNLLAAQRERRSADGFETLLRGVVSVDDVGPAYDAETFDWSKALSGDRIYAIVMSRVCTFGPTFDMRMACRACRDTYEWTVDLNDLPIQRLRAEDAAVFQAGNRFQGKIGDVNFTYQLMTGVTERRAQKLVKSMRDQPLTAGIMGRVLEVEGAKLLKSWFDDVDMDVIDEMRAQMESHDCGLETEFDTQCTECGALNEVQLPFASKGFWMPGTQRKMNRETVDQTL